MSDRDTYIDRMLLAEDLELALTGGCPACGLQADQMCAACDSCNCDSHEGCVRPATERTTA